MESTHTRSPDRYHLVHHVIARFRDRGWFSSTQCTLGVYIGAPEVHPQQRKRIRETLDQYVAAGILKRDDDIAACPLYRHAHPSADEVNKKAVMAFEAHAASRPWSMIEELSMRNLDQDLDQLVPRGADPSRFMRDGRLLPSADGDKPHYMWERLAGPEPPSALAYVRKPDQGADE
jgi:hypothetical protein